ncbi:FadR family transcriptional regulator [Fulvimarina endophytica]|uniref:FadR family transcriptional regulator n=2 Tax=Fulvimarina endophytica TaxID=2293836 RepID=A0A371WXV9_9HYPH|nr:FadR/GntR family transcriptional regulator [Fulvimarina endophytica]RFC61813.1 FadR family transcriptional regulator [Fulvimarina endophytica]
MVEADEKPVRRRINRVSEISERLRRIIQSGHIAVGQKLPTEAALTSQYQVSRTVVREAIASLRSDGLVESRQGAGVFVLSAGMPDSLGLTNIDPSRISSVIEMLEIRTAIEVEAAALASQRRSPAQDEAIYEGCEVIEALIKSGSATTEADLAFHFAIADATNNARFREFLTMLGSSVIPRRALQNTGDEQAPADYLNQIQAEHRQIAKAISIQDETAARDAMRRHLKGGQARYRRLLRGT